MSSKSIDSAHERDILECHVPEEVLAVLLKDRSTGKNLIWATDDYAARGKGFGAHDEMRVTQIIDKDNPVIRPRVDTGEPVELGAIAENCTDKKREC